MNSNTPLKLLEELKNKTLLLASLNCTKEDEFSRKNLYPPFKKLFGKVALFDTKINYFHFGKEKMNKNFLKVLKKENPDYLFLDLGYDEFYLETLEKIKKISPKTVTLTLFGDDNWRYDDFSRYYALFFDYIFISEKMHHKDYGKDGLKNTTLLLGANTEIFKPLNLNKKYDVTFIGMPLRDRYDFIKFLFNQGIKIRLFGQGWSSYSDFSAIWGGCLNIEDYPKIINQSRINLNFSKTMLKGKRDTQVKGRIFEIPACKSFLLTEYFEGIEDYFKKYKQLCFNNKKQLLEKIEYYLKNEKKREKIAQEVYKVVVSEFVWEKQLNNFFKKILKKEKSKKSAPKTFPQINKKTVLFPEKDFSLALEQIKKKVTNADYIYFETNQCTPSKFRNYFQAYSLEKSKKQISCCDYSLYTKSLGDYMLFTAKKAFNTIEKQDFLGLLNINQLMVSKEFFLENIKKFKELFNGKKVDIINEENTVFVSIPLIKIKKINPVKQSSMNEAFKIKFIDQLFSLLYQRKILFSRYPYKLLLKGALGDFFILRFLYSYLIDKANWEKLKAF